MATTKPKYHRKGVRSEVSPRVRFLLRELLDLGTSDIYTDAWEYESRVGVLQELYFLLGKILRGEQVTDVYGKVRALKARAVADDETDSDEDASEELSNSN